jgi:hypothetical protein
MKNLKEIIIGIVSIILGVGGTSAYLGYTGDNTGTRVTIYGSETGTTAVTSTAKAFRLGSSKSTINLNVKTSSTAAQTITFYPEYSNDGICSSTGSTWFRETNVGISAGATTLSTTTQTMQVPVGPFYQNVQIDDLNAECIKLSFTGSSSTVTSMLWIDAIIK